jgi:hypothetical protein
MSEDQFEIGWALCGDCCFEDKEPYFMCFFPSIKHANMVLKKMQKLAIVDEFQVRACVWAPEGFYVGTEGETQDQVYARVRELESEPDANAPDANAPDSIETLLANANVLTEAFPEEWDQRNG